MNMQENLRVLASRETPVAPFGFEAFEQRRAMAAARRRAALVSTTAAVFALAFVSVMALVTQRPPQQQPDAPPQVVAVSSEEMPALVNLDQFDVTAELEEHIAVLDAELSVARVQAAPAEELRQLESTRAQLRDSLQRVSYAHSLLSL
jgi:hypothetical protein